MADSTRIDREEISRRAVEAANRGDVEAVLADYTEDAAWDMSSFGLGAYTGRAEIRRFLEEGFGTYADYSIELLEFVELHGAVTIKRTELKLRTPVGRRGDGQSIVPRLDTQTLSMPSTSQRSSK